MFLPTAKPSCHILCAVDIFGNTLAGFGIVVATAALSAFSFVLCVARRWPMTNLRST